MGCLRYVGICDCCCFQTTHDEERFFKYSQNTFLAMVYTGSPVEASALSGPGGWIPGRMSRDSATWSVGTLPASHSMTGTYTQRTTNSWSVSLCSVLSSQFSVLTSHNLCSPCLQEYLFVMGWLADNVPTDQRCPCSFNREVLPEVPLLRYLTSCLCYVGICDCCCLQTTHDEERFFKYSQNTFLAMVYK